MKTSAVDYLIEYINSENEDDWIKSVVSCYLSSGEKINNLEIQNLTKDLLTYRNRKYSLDTSNTISNTSELIKLNKLVHKSGVNALAKNQKIVFNDDVTILYGLNGSGKSSYFRILQALIGNIKSSDIIPNIYLDNFQNINVDIEYSINQKKYSINWCNNGEIINLKSIKVFDSNYSKKFLEKRKSDEQVLFPYKLYMFSEISNYIDQIKRAANEKINERLKNNVPPKIDDFTEEEKKRFEREMTVEDERYFLSRSENFGDIEEKKLIKIQSEIQLLSETNYSDKLKLLYSKREKYNEVKKRVDDSLLPWINKSVEYNNQINLYKRYKKESEKNREFASILSNLPGVESIEWKDFIKRGLKISESSDELNNVCPYCHREYDDQSLQIVKAYAVFIKDVTEAKLRDCESEIKDLINKAKYTKITKEDYIIEGYEELQSEILSLFNLVSDYLESLKNMGNSIENIEPIIFDEKIIVSKFDDLENEYKHDENKLVEESNERENNLSKLKNEEVNLKSQKSINEQIDVISNYINNELNICKLREKVNSVSSYKISNLSKKAHEDLLSDKLVIKFNKFLQKLDLMGHEIELKSSTSKGVQQTELVMKSKKTDVTNILSEGEQKVVSIALFLSEIVVANNKSPIILDDPVNSLDHKMISCLSDILLQLDNQVIIFTHNRMFLDSISGSSYGHLCKNFKTNGCNKNKGRHIFIYQIKSEGISEKGVITSKINDSAKGYLSAAKELLDKTPFNEELKVCALLRNAIDKIIDEIVFNNQIPRKYSIKGVNQSIQWDALKEMASNHEIIEDLHRIHGRVSAGALHIGQQSSNNPPDKQELIAIYEDLISMV